MSDPYLRDTMPKIWSNSSKAMSVVEYRKGPSQSHAGWWQAAASV